MVAEADDLYNGETADEQIVHKELEVHLAEMETRLRRAVLKVVRPTLDQAGELTARLVGIEGKVKRHEGLLDFSDELKEEVKNIREFMGVIQEQLNTTDKQARKFEEKTTFEITELRNRATTAESRLDTNEGDIRRSLRDFNRVWEETQRLQLQHDEFSRSVNAKIEIATKKTEQARAELLDLNADMQKQHNDLIEDLFGDNKGLTLLRNDVHVLEVAVEPMPRLEDRIEETLKKVLDLEDQVEASNSTCDGVSGKFDQLEKSVNIQLNDYDQSNKSVMNKLTAYHASVLKSVRTEFVEEIQASKQLREEIGKFEDATATMCRDIHGMIEKEVSRVDALYKELVTDIEDVGKRVNKERLHLNSGLQRVERDAQSAQQVSESNASSMEHIARVLALVLESERMSSALHVQEFADRCTECWLGVPSDAKKRKPPQPYTAQNLDKLSPNFENVSRSFAGDDMTSVVPIDPKIGLAKLEYLPGAITYGGSHYERKGFLQMHHRMLQKAKGFLDRGPENLGPAHLSQPHSNVSPRPSNVSHFIASASAGYPDKPAAPSPDVVVVAQPSARGGESGTELPLGPPKIGGDEVGALEDPKFQALRRQQSTGASFGGQRPGSRHQPQAVGSRGTAAPQGSIPLGPAVPLGPARSTASSLARQSSHSPPPARGTAAAHHGSTSPSSSRTSTRLPRIVAGRPDGQAQQLGQSGFNSSLPMESLNLGGVATGQAKAKAVDSARRAGGALTAR